LDEHPGAGEDILINDDEQVRVALPIKAQLGEGLHWDERRQCLWMVDIHGQRLIQWDLKSPTWQEWATPQRIGWVIPERDSDHLIVGLQQGIARATLGERDLLVLDWLARPFEGRPWMRLNDAKMDASGAIWAGSMNNDDESQPDGCLYRLGPDGSFRLMDSGYTVANGPAISPDGRLMLHTDSGRRTIYAFDLDVAAGTLSNKRVWKQFGEADGYPDGMTFDAQGFIWIAHWAGGRVSRFSPAGVLLRVVTVAATDVTNLCFAGPYRDRLFITSARRRADSDDLSGDCFEVIGFDGSQGAENRL
jgi:xylono-1,5-lactonase